ncbi:hypothetical protein LAZ67_4003825 [Cordylochernes scorpioides]|uniref:Integrase catalytic domain-containing protein n=1 Tax=Cordylochernes scorpioides TaxID=51811 RepID=A0ABY6KEQ4_9ARAC|nr:hypothetical protein LAZ67_4003825 [Cordylochernes scorpioides]
MDKIKKLRTRLRSSATKYINEIETEFEKEYPSRDSILVVFKLLETNVGRLRSKNSQIEELMLDDENTTVQELEKEQDLVDQYERNFLLIEKKVAEYLDPKGNDPQGQGDVASIGSSPERSALCRLPKIALKVYDGTSLEWLGWWSQFEAIHENPNLSEVDKFQYLIQSMKVGTRAERLVKSYPLTEANYPKVIEALRDRFGDKVILTEVYVRQLLKLVINNERKKNISLESLYDQVESHLRSLDSLGVNVQQSSSFLYPLVESSLLEELIRIWQRSAMAGYDRDEKELIPSVDQRLTSLLAFVRREVKGEQRIAYIKDGFGESPRNRDTGHYVTGLHTAKIGENAVKRVPWCIICHGNHWIQSCPKWCSMPVPARVEALKKANAYFKCLRVGHTGKTCRSTIRCAQCQGGHNKFLHRTNTVSREIQDPNDREMTSPKNPPAPIDAQEVEFSGMHVRTAIPKALLATALIRIVNPHGNGVVVRALLDQGSQSSFIQRDLLQHLSVPTCGVNVQVYGVNNIKGEHVKELAPFALESLTEPGWTLPMKALVVGRMTGLLPTKDLCLAIPSSWKVLPLADPQFEKCGKVDVILGADVYGRVLLPDLRFCDKTHLCAQNTRLGWVISGELPKGDRTSPHLVYNICVKYEDHLDELIQRVWEVEEIPSRPTESEEDEFCRNLYKREVQRTPGGRYIVPLPFDPRVGMQDCFGNSLDLCVKRQMSLERRLVLNEQLGRDYYKFMEEYEGLGHMTQLTEIPVGDQVEHCYLPHHAVLGGQPDRGKFRVVFDASAKTKNGFSFNDRLYTGPKLQRDILSILMNCRRHRIFIMSDIEKMYRQILVCPGDAERQIIIWRRSSQDKLMAYRLNTVTYGTAAAPFLAMRTLLKLVEDEGAKYPRASRAIIKDTYVDDIITGADDQRDGMALRDELIELLSCGRFTLKKWSSNDPTILGNIAKEHCAQKFTFEESKVLRTLGLGWIQGEDCFLYDVQSLEKTSVTTKREMLSFIAKLYDPLGWLAPVLVTGKIMVQRLWITGLHWDDPMDESLIETWTKFRKELNCIGSVRIPRWLGLGRNTQGVQLHGFGDASEDAYAAAVYIRIPTDDGVNVNSTLRIVRSSSPDQTNEIYTGRVEYQNGESATCWSDSTIVLSWIRTMSRNLPTFIGNRVAEIQSCPQIREWRYVPTGDNPANIASRGILGSELKQSSIWWTGPTWLSAESTEWPRKLHVFENQSQTELLSVHAISETPFLVAIGAMSSTFTGYIRKVAWILRFCHNCRYSAERYQSHLTTAELRNAHRRILQSIQFQHFREDIRSLTTLGSVKRTSKIYGLTPFLDDQGILRVGGRLKWAPSMTYEQKHPALLPSSGQVAQMIIQAVHMRTLHGSVHLMLSTEVLDAESKRSGQLMSDLPKERLTPGKPFSISGVDYAGPVSLRLSKGRGRKTEKGYICLFVCFVTRAVHLELVTDASTPTFMSTFKRFVARRGHCTRLYSDQGTNFVGAARQLRSCFYLAQNQLKELAAVLANDGTEWRFNPPGAPHFGGLWEAGVKALKYHMRRIIGNNLLTYEELLTVLVQIESCLNSRPLYSMSNDPNDQGVLTPAHFLLTEPSSCVPEDDLLLVKNHLLTIWQLTQRVLQHLWKRWSRDYLNNLQQRNKWKTISPNIDINTLVLIKEERMPPARWLMGRVVETHPGKDGLVRVVSVRTSVGVLRRPLVKLVLLPVAPQNLDVTHQLGEEYPILKIVCHNTLYGWMEKPSNAEMLPFYLRKEEITVEQGIFLLGTRVIIPRKFRANMKKELHLGHMGVVKMKSLSRNFIWWPLMDREIEEIARSCKECETKIRKCNRWESAPTPWYRIHMDFAGPFMNNMFLIIVDSYSKWPEVIAMNSTTTQNTIKVLREIFSRYGIPEQVVTDNGPQFVSNEMKFFFKSNGIQHLKSAPYYPATNVPQSSTKEASAVLFLKKMPKGRWNLLRPNFESKAKLGKKTFPEFEVNEDVLVRDNFGPNRWIEGEITEKLGKCFYRILLRDKRVWRRHAGQISKNWTLPCPDPEVFLPTPQNIQRNYEDIPLDKTATSSSREDAPLYQPTPGTSAAAEQGTLRPSRRYPLRERRPS